MAITAENNLLFVQADPVTGKPNVDGFATADAGVITGKAESGYVNGSRVAIGGAGLPPVVIQTIRDGNAMVIGIMCRGDKSFDDVDSIIIGLKEQGGAVDGPQRRIDIFPVWGDTGFPPNPAEVGYGAADRDPMNASLHKFEAVEGTPEDPAYEIRTNKEVRLGPVYYQRANDAADWISYAPTGAATEGATDTGGLYRARARSWLPSVAAMSPLEYAWSIEIRLPFDKATGGADWIDLAEDFGIYIDVIRGGRNDLGGGFGEYYISQYVFPLDSPDLGNVIDPTTKIPLTSYGHGLKNGALAQGLGVRIKGGELGIGRRPLNDPAAALTNQISQIEDNLMVTLIENTGPEAPKVKAEVRMANFGLGSGDFTRWNLAPGCQNPSPEVLVPAGSPGTPSEAETGNSWLALDVPAEYDPPNAHQCMWVQLDSTDGSVLFAQSSARRNMDIVPLSEEKRPVEISGEGYPPPADGSGQHDFLLFTRCRRIVVHQLIGSKTIDPETLEVVSGALKVARVIPGEDRIKVATASTEGHTQEWKDSVVYLWVTEGFRRTGEKVSIFGKEAQRLDWTPRQFGLIAHHEGVDDNVNWSFEGPELVRYRPGVIGVKVPHEGRVKLDMRLAAGKDEPAGDVSKLPEAPRGGFGYDKPDDTQGGTDGPAPLPGGCPTALIRWLVRILKRLFGSNS
ncbi:MAG TPA: hypothetical protein VF619_08665 [Allosphingosinicella sp.]|jgi:hypothetical protein